MILSPKGDENRDFGELFGSKKPYLTKMVILSNKIDLEADMSKLFGLFSNKGVDDTNAGMTPVIAIAAEKGGVGKTTTAVNIAANLVRMKDLRVLLVDMDPQGHVYEALKQFVTDRPEKSLSDVLLSRKPQFMDTVTHTDINGLYVAVSDRSLRQTESVLAGRIGKEFVLEKAMAAIRATFDCIILDSPPNLGNLTLNAVVAASHVIVPVDMSPLAATALRNMMQTLDTIEYSLGRGPDVLGILRTKVDRRRLRVNQDVGKKLEDEFGELLFKAMIPESTSVTRSQMAGIPLSRFDKNSTAAQSYEKITEEILQRLSV